MPESTLYLLLFLALVISGAKLAGAASTRLGQPAVLGELLFGLLVGPSFLDLLALGPFAHEELHVTVEHLAEIGVIMLMFLAGLEVEFDDLRRSGKVSLLAGSLGVLVPLVLGALVVLPLGYSMGDAIFIGIILTATSVSISAQTLIELGVLRSREGIAMLGAAVVDDVLGIMVLSLYMAMAMGGGPASLATTVLRVIGFGILAAVVGIRLVPKAVAWVQRLRIGQGAMALAVTTALLFSWSAEALGGMAAITGAFMAGMFFARTSWHHEIARGSHTLVYSFLAPVFFVSIGLKADIGALDAASLVMLAGILVVAVVSKVIGCGAGALLGGFPRISALRVGVGMISRGEVGLIVCNVGLGAGLIGQGVFCNMVIMVLFTTLVTPVLLRFVFPLRGEAPAAATPPGGE